MQGRAQGQRVLTHQVRRVGGVGHIAVHVLDLTGHAQGERIAQHVIVMAFAAQEAVIAAFEADLAGIAVQRGAVLDEVDATDQRALTEQGGLRAFDHFDPFHVIDGEVGGKGDVADGDAVLEHGDARGAAIRDHAAQRVARRVEALGLNLQARHEIAEILEIVGGEQVDQILVRDGNIDRNVDQGLLLLLGRDGHDFEVACLIRAGILCVGG